MPNGSMRWLVVLIVGGLFISTMVMNIIGMEWNEEVNWFVTPTPMAETMPVQAYVLVTTTPVPTRVCIVQVAVESVRIGSEIYLQLVVQDQLNEYTFLLDTTPDSWVRSEFRRLLSGGNFQPFPLGGEVTLGGINIDMTINGFTFQINGTDYLLPYPPCP